MLSNQYPIDCPRDPRLGTNQVCSDPGIDLAPITVGGRVDGANALARPYCQTKYGVGICFGATLHSVLTRLTLHLSPFS